MPANEVNYEEVKMSVCECEHYSLVKLNRSCYMNDIVSVWITLLQGEGLCFEKAPL